MILVSTNFSVNVKLSTVIFQIYIEIFFASSKIFFTHIIFVHTLTEILDGFSMDLRIVSSATTRADSPFTVEVTSAIVVESTDSLAKLNSCSASTPPSVVTVTNRDVPEPAMAVLYTIVSLVGDGADARVVSAT